MLIIYTLEPDSLLYFKQFWGIHRVASATVRTLWFQTHKRHFNPGKGTSLSQFSHSQMSHTKLTMDHNFQYVLIRAVHLGCLNHRIEVEVLGHILGKGLTSNTEPLFYRIYMYIYMYMYNCVINLTFAYTCMCTFSANCLLSPWHRVAVCDQHSKSARSKVWPRQLAHPTEHHSSMSDSCSFRIETSDIPDAKRTSFVSGPAVEMEHLALVWAHPYQWQNGSSCLLASTENIRKQWLIKRASNRDQLQMYLSWHSLSLSDILLQHLKSEEISLRMGPHHRHR